MEFNVIFSQTILTAYLRYPQIEDLVEEEVLAEPEVQLIRKRRQPMLKTSGPQLPETSRSKLSAPPRSKLITEVERERTSEGLLEEVPKLLRQPTP
jgi:hypothetical protein